MVGCCECGDELPFPEFHDYLRICCLPKEPHLLLMYLSLASLRAILRLSRNFFMALAGV